MGISDKFSRLVILLSLGSVIGGAKACREDYCVACNATVGTIAPTSTTTPSVTPTGSITPTVTLTSIPSGTLTPTPTGTITITPTPSPTETDSAEASMRGALRKLSQESAIGSAMTQKAFGNWLGSIAQDDSDSDNDGYTDWLEQNSGSNVNDASNTPRLNLKKFLRTADHDGDGLSDNDETLLGTDPKKADTDGDGCSDGAEYLSGSQPTVKDKIQNDSDQDCLSDEIENELGTSAIAKDSDTDGLSDTLEIAIGTDPNRKDTDGDGILDRKEIELSTNPLIKDE
jgi:hypothetical protein